MSSLPRTLRGQFRSLRLRIACTVAIAPATAHAQTVSDTPRPEIWVTNDQVYCVVKSCGVLYLGGFTSVCGQPGGGAL